MAHSDFYQRYLKSPAWFARRAAALQRAGGQCQRCRSPHRLEVHHRTYVRLGSEGPQDLEVLCRACHRREHTQQRRVRQSVRHARKTRQ